MTLNKQGFVLAEITMVLLLVSLTCCSILAAYQGSVRIMQKHNKMVLATELAEAADSEAAAKEGLLLERETLGCGFGIKQEVIAVLDGQSGEMLVNKVNYVVP